MIKTKILDYIKNHHILWQPIKITTTIDEKGKQLKKPIPIGDYTPNLSDYKNISEDVIKTRQKNIDKTELIAINTNIIQQFDIDDDLGIFKINGPYFESITKKLPHYFFKLIETETTGDRKAFSGADLLNGQWSYCKKDAIVFDAELEIPEISIEYFINQHNKYKEFKKLLVKVKTLPDVDNYITWFNVCNAIFNATIDLGFCKNIGWVHSFSKNSEKYNDNAIKIIDALEYNKYNFNINYLKKLVDDKETSLNSNTPGYSNKLIEYRDDVVLVEEPINKETKKKKSVEGRQQTSLENFREIVYEYTERNNIVKRGDFVFSKVHPFYYKDYYFDHNTDSKNIKSKMGLRDLINEIMKNNDLFKSKTSHMDELLKYIKTTKNLESFKELKINNGYLAFKNCVLELKTAKILQFSDVLENICCRNYIEEDFVYEKEGQTSTTPNFDNVLETQIHDPIERKLFMVVNGRLFFKVGEMDDYQICPFIKGAPHCGKSTIVNVMTSIMGKQNIGCMTKHDKQFALASVYGKDLMVMPDVPENTENYIDSDSFLSMISGEQVPLRNMNIAGETVDWETPIFMAGMHFPKFEDKSGGINRRFVFFSFNTHIVNKDGTLKNALLKESPNIAYKYVKAYVDFMGDNPTEADFSKFMTENMLNMRNEFQNNSDPLSTFLQLSKSKVGLYYYSTVYKKNNLESLTDFNSRFSGWLSCNKQFDQKYKLNSDSPLFAKNGFNRISYKICKNCDKKASANPQCCDMYNNNNRTTKFFYEHMLLIKDPVIKIPEIREDSDD